MGRPGIAEADAVVLGMSLGERLTHAGPPGPPGPTAPAERAERAERRLARWRSAPSFEAAGGFERRLAADGIDEHGLLLMLADDTRSLTSRLTGRPEWLRFYADALRGGGTVEFPVEDRLNFARVLQPLLRAADRRLRDGLAGAEAAVRQALPELRRSVLPLLHAMLARSVVLELNVARVTGTLADLPTSEERFHTFLDDLARPERLRRFLTERPVLARQLCTALMNWADSSALCCRRLSADLPVLARTLFPGRDLGGVRAVELGMGDRHAGGRTVGTVTFADGSRVVYKPRPVGVDVHFQDLLRRLNSYGPRHPFRTLRYLSRGDYGWAEHVAAGYAEGHDAVRRFYHRQGGLLAVLHLLDASDLHAENLIAAGDQPVLVDLETLLQPRILTFPRDVLDAERAADLYAVGSVLRSGLLPAAVWQGTDRAGIDLSGLGRHPGQLTPMPVPGFAQEGLDDMHIGLARREVAPADNRPRPHSEPLRLIDFVPDLESGFSELFGILRAEAAALTAEDGPLAAFAGDEVRVLRRSTVEYGAVLDTSLHPDLVRDGLDLDRHLDRLWRRTGTDPGLAAFVPDERADLWNNDIPYFTARPGARQVWNSRGRALPLELDRAPLAIVLEKARRLDDAELARQSWLLRASVLASSTELERGRAFVPMEPATTTDAPGSPVERAVVHAARIADRLTELSYSTDSQASWLGLSLVAGTRWTLGRVGPDLCTGTAGIALFLATLARLTKEPQHIRPARRATATLRAQLARGDLRGSAGMAGLGGVVYALVRLALLEEDEELLAVAAGLVDAVREAADGDTSFDVIGGSAGSIGGLLALQAVRPHDRVLSAVRVCADRLVARAAPAGPGLGWLPAAFVESGMADRPLSGFAHGGAGIAWALAGAGAALTDTGLIATAAAALRYERTLYDPAERNWLDLRTDPAGGPAPARAFMTAWCHGAAGIGMSRLRLAAVLGDPEAAAETEIALGTVRHSGFGLNHSLCHGDLGNLDLLVQAGSDERARLDRLSGILTTIDRYGVVPGTPLAVEAPGLLTGLAGVGYGLLRAARPDVVPSVLTLQARAGDRPC